MKRLRKMKRDLFNYYFKTLYMDKEISLYELKKEMNISALRAYSFLKERELKEICLTKEKALSLEQSLPAKFEKETIYVLLELEANFYAVNLADKSNNDLFGRYTSLDKIAGQERQKIIVKNN